MHYWILIEIADAYPCNKKTYNSAVSALRRAACVRLRHLDYPERRDPAASLKCARIGKPNPKIHCRRDREDIVHECWTRRVKSSRQHR